ncbi:MAG: ADP-ribosylglycohydrolase family protein [Candidatus Magasanikbacteria bacterium]|nr:ADP-ribosylglycohydrolase family protein [Candidatus Magasanikbacteria bacterium]
MFFKGLEEGIGAPSMASRVAGCFAGIAIGDAMGMPVEMMTRQEIHHRFGRVRGFVKPFAGSHPYKLGLMSGDTTDDTQLTTAVAQALIWGRGFDLTQLSKEHVKALEESIVGWGDTTVRAVSAMKERWQKGQRIYKPVPQCFSLENKDCGNGVVVKVAPVAVWRVLKAGSHVDGEDGRLLQSISQLGALTHSDPRASIAAYAVAKTLFLVLSEYVDFSFIHLLFDDIFYSVQTIENNCGIAGEKNILSTNLAKARYKMLDKGYPSSEVSRRLGTASFVLESAPFSIVTALRHIDDFRAGVLEAVNAGGDTDSNASVVGAIIGANVGLEGIPPEWLRFSPAYLEMARLGLELYATFSK